ncbi:MAG: DivIVA domain-containing protein [Nostocoides sp.]
MTRLLTIADVEQAWFRGTYFHAGYDMEEVDLFLDRVVEAFRRLEDGQPCDLSVDEVAGMTFGHVHGRRGYDIGQVNDLVNDIRETLAHRLAGGTVTYAYVSPEVLAGAGFAGLAALGALTWFRRRSSS